MGGLHRRLHGPFQPDIKAAGDSGLVDYRLVETPVQEFRERRHSDAPALGQVSTYPNVSLNSLGRG